jgi:hypothetical protein
MASQGCYAGPCWHAGDCLVDGARPEFRTAGGSESKEPRMNTHGRESNRSFSLASIRVHSRFCKLCDSDNEHPGRVAAAGYGTIHPTLSFNPDKPLVVESR